ncbi:MAG: permease [Candidatus Omnitrophica bacterium]|nr:permease [Candidatus Omnitrophota bacterium]
MLSEFITWLLYSVLRFDPESTFAEPLHFFVYDTIKIILLLFVMISVIGFIRSYLSAQKIKEWIARRGMFGHVFASMFGAVTPFCSCSSIPIFFGFLEAGIPLGVTFSFLITSPLINEYLVVLMLGFFGWKITLLYTLSGILIGVMVGIILGKMNLDRFIRKDISAQVNNPQCACAATPTIKSRIIFGINEAISIVKKLWLWIIVGVGLGAVIHNYVPQDMVETLISKTEGFTVLIATVLGVPMYGSCAAIVPIAVVLFQKGIPLGTALSFMMATAALSLPEAVLLRRAMRMRLILIFFGITALGIVAIGYLFNYIQPLLK